MLQQKVAEHLQLRLKPGVLRRLLREANYRWKRMRNSVKGQRDEVLFRFFQQELQLLEQEQEKGEIDLIYFDESGFHLHPQVPYAWQPVGQTAELPAKRGRATSVIGSFGKHHPFEGVFFEGAINSQIVVAVLDRIAQKTKRKTVLILDNASIHKANLVIERIPKWKQQNLYLQFIPAYSPELNLIEILWKQIKHFWLPPEAYHDKQTLKSSLEHIFKHLGTKYQINFS